MHCWQYGRSRPHLTARFLQVKQSSVAPPAAVRLLLFLAGGAVVTAPPTPTEACVTGEITDGGIAAACMYTCNAPPIRTSVLRTGELYLGSAIYVERRGEARTEGSHCYDIAAAPSSTAMAKVDLDPRYPPCLGRRGDTLSMQCGQSVACAGALIECRSDRRRHKLTSVRLWAIRPGFGDDTPPPATTSSLTSNLPALSTRAGAEAHLVFGSSVPDSTAPLSSSPRPVRVPR